MNRKSDIFLYFLYRFVPAKLLRRCLTSTLQTFYTFYTNQKRQFFFPGKIKCKINIHLPCKRTLFLCRAVRRGLIKQGEITFETTFSVC